jgi:hypothetical protein
MPYYFNLICYIFHLIYIKLICAFDLIFRFVCSAMMICKLRLQIRDLSMSFKLYALAEQNAHFLFSFNALISLAT